MRRWLLSFLLAAVPQSVMASPADVVLSSPDGTITLELMFPDDGPPTYTVMRGDELVVAPSPLGLVYTDRSRTDAMRLKSTARTTTDRTIAVTASKASVVRDRFEEMVVGLRDPSGKARPFDLRVRAYNDGIAFRYEVPGAAEPISIWQERTGFYLPPGDTCWGSMVGSVTSSHESEFDVFDPSRIHPYYLYDTGTLCKSASRKTSFLIAEADLDRYGGMYLNGRGDGGIGFDTVISQRDGERRIAASRAAGEALATPWRVVLMSDRAGDLIASNTIGNLNPPPVGDWRWVRPGKAAWDWWSGPYFPGQRPRPTNMADLEKLIDFAGRSGLEYMLIDEGWALNSGSGGSAPAETDITRTEPRLDMPTLVAYAKRRGVDLLLWVQWRHIDARMTAALDQYVRWGIKGIKVDFMDRNDAGMVDFYHRIVAETAKRHLLVNLHGAYHPTGLTRTMPNFIAQEGVMGAEYNKWSRRVTAIHNVRLAYTRLVLGPMDYTPGGFRNRAPTAFEVVNSPPEVQTTRAAGLAMYVVYESPLQVVADSPDAYAGQPEFAFIRDVPTVWGETRFIAGDVDDYVIVARRKGRSWYIGALNGPVGRVVSIPLQFLGSGAFDAVSWKDGRDFKSAIKTQSVVTASAELEINLAGSGGFAMALRPRQ